jgi:hypothetical protein
MGELFRVLRPGGRLVAVDADHTRTATDADDAELADMAQVATNRIGLVNPSSRRRLRSQMVQAGFVDVTVDSQLRVITDRELWRKMIPPQIEDVLDTLVTNADVARPRADAHLADLARRQEEGRFLVAIPGYVVIGVKPPRATGEPPAIAATTSSGVATIGATNFLRRGEFICVFPLRVRPARLSIK